MKSYIIKFFIFFFFQNLSSQTITGYILNSKKEGISNARIVNLSKQLYSYSDTHGFFEIFHEKGDSLRVSHLNYENLSFLYKKRDTIKLKEKTIQLNEIVISNVKKNNITIKNKKYDSWYALSSSSEYAFKLGGKKYKKYYLNNISLPIKKKNTTENFEVLMFQIYEYDKDNNYIGKPISEAITIKSEEIKEIINLEFNKPIYIKSSYFYLVISNSIDKKNSKISHKSINPYFAIKKGYSKKTFLLRNYINGIWYDSMEYNYPYSPILKCKIEIEI